MHKSDNAFEQNPKSLEYDEFEEDEGLNEEKLKENNEFEEE